ncbi:fructose-bisphosphate aldolase class I [Candidatus Peribacteria bacterium]|nr:fructose-bisphosphate aldolase class I [Candidatus Peribacteria bacterium]
MHDMFTTIDHLFTPGKGILAADESKTSIGKRFRELGIADTPELHRQYRECLFSTPELEEYISGVILSDETIHQTMSDGTPFAASLQQRGMLPGIKVDRGLTPAALSDAEQWTEGLDGLRERLQAYKALGAVFAKWRAVFVISESTPTLGNLQANCQTLARYAALCEEAGIVPIVEPEVLYDGTHCLSQSYEVHEQVWRELVYQLYQQGVSFETTILKASMVLSGKEHHHADAVEDVAAATIQGLSHTLPASLGGVVFLSGGQSNEQAYAHLNAMCRDYTGLPWALTYSYGRALHARAMAAWGGQEAHIPAAQEALLADARACSLASRGALS